MKDVPDPQGLRRALELFDRALDLGPLERTIFLAAECGDDALLRDEVIRLLAADAQDDAIDLGVAAADLGGIQDDPPDNASGERLGVWRLENPLGQGGMGAVYAAVRDDGGVQRVAIKRLRRHWNGSPQALRFLRERRILAALSHANIPALIDHGVDDEGRAWFALEYVDGENFTAWADAQQLNLRARIALFQQVCAAVQHAHERFVVHRDLKPANILVGRDGRVRVLDFGAAKRLDQPLEDATRTGMFAGFTPEYAAPEQITGGAITAATDVYALGVILYRLLAGRLPYQFDHHDLRAVAEAVSTRPAERLDQAITTGTAEEVKQRLAARDTDLGGFRRFVRGDLMRIIETAMAKEPRRRYASVQRLADDLKQFLEGRPVSVSGDTFGYRAGKFLGRNRWSVAMATLAALALAGGTAFSTWQAREARVQRDAERAQRERSEQVLGFVRELFAGNLEDGGFANLLTAVQLLDRAAARIDAAFPEDPVGKAQLLDVVARTYTDVGEFSKARDYAERALDLTRAQRERVPLLYLERVIALLQVMEEQEAQGDAIIALVDRELPFARVLASGQANGSDRTRADDVLEELLMQRGKALRLLGDYERAEADLREAVVHGEARSDQPNLAIAYSDLALLYSDTGRLREALALHEKAGEALARNPDEQPLTRPNNLYNRAVQHKNLGESEQAQALLEEAVRQYDTLIGPGHDRTLRARNVLAQVYAIRGLYDQAVALSRQNVEVSRRSRDVPAEQKHVDELVLAKLLLYAGRPAEALATTQEGVAFFRDKYPQPTRTRATVEWIHGETLLRLDRCVDATPVLQSALDGHVAVAGGAPSSGAGEALDSLGRCRLLQGDAAGAEPLLTRAIAQFTAVLGADSPRTLRSDAHRLWAAHGRGDADALPALSALRERLAVTLAGNGDPLLAQLDRLIAGLRDRSLPPDFRGINSLS